MPIRYYNEANNMGIAIIEDDPNIMSLLKILLADLKLQVDGFDNGWQG